MIILHQIQHANRAHEPKSRWTKERILFEISYYYSESESHVDWKAWKLDDLRTLLIKDGYQTYGGKNVKAVGHAALYCLDLEKLKTIEETAEAME